MPYKKGKGLVAAALLASLCLLPGLVPAPVRAAGEVLRAWDRRRYRPARWSISSVSAILTPN